MRFILRLLLVVALLLPALLPGWLIYFAGQPLQLPVTPFRFELKSGASVHSVARQLVDMRLLVEPWSFIVLARTVGKSSQLKPGNYELSEAISPSDLLNKITKGLFAQSEITFVEGQTFAQMRKILDAHPDAKHDSTGLSESEILQRVGAAESAAEGLFFPDTYAFNKGMSDVDILKRSYKTMQNRLASAWAKRAASVPYASPYEALIMASIIEKETASKTERPIIAAVFVNRLRSRMRLQTDPTVIYGIADKYDGTLHKRDLAADTPYNTYLRPGLPPTPIAMPGLASIEAALNPSDSSALYFVARGDGSHEFSASLAEHNRAVAKFQR
jgi:UPF0755 protein